MYSRADVIPSTVTSMIQQEGNMDRELILVDDCSTDNTVEVIREHTKLYPYTTIVENSGKNKGPSYRLNQGAKLAKGKYLHFLDHDDILPTNAAQIMYECLEESGADFVYGNWQITDKQPEELLNQRINDPKPHYHISENPFQTMFQGRFIRMCTMVRKEYFEKCGGFDESIFIQDENLPLRLASGGGIMANLRATVNLVPKNEKNLSDNKTQLNHDRFLAYYNLLKTRPPKEQKHKDEVIRRALSSGWKQFRQDNNFPIFSGAFLKYLKSKISLESLDTDKELVEIYDMFKTKDVLRP